MARVTPGCLPCKGRGRGARGRDPALAGLRVARPQAHGKAGRGEVLDERGTVVPYVRVELDPKAVDVLEAMPRVAQQDPYSAPSMFVLRAAMRRPGRRRGRRGRRAAG